MSKQQHTKWPWILCESEVVRFGDTEPTKICEIFCADNNKLVCEIPDYRYHPEYEESDRADARLIAAAPELLEALIEAEHWVSEFVSQMSAYTISDKAAESAVRIRTAIAKARGEA